MGITLQQSSQASGLPSNIFSTYGNLPNVKIVPLYKQFTPGSAGPFYDLYTVPVGRRAIFGQFAITSPSGFGLTAGAAQYFVACLKDVNANYYAISNALGSVAQGATASSAPVMPYIAEAGESLSFISPPTNSICLYSQAITSCANASSTVLTLSQVLGTVNGLTVYIGTITGGASNALAGRHYTVAGFTNAGNNAATMLCVASSATTLTLQNTGGVAETKAGTATNNFTVYTGSTFPSVINPQGLSYTVTGFVTNPGNNGTFVCVSSAAGSVTLENPNGVAETVAALAYLNASFAVTSNIIEFDNTATLKSVKSLAPAVGTVSLYTPSGSTNAMLVGSSLFGNMFANSYSIAVSNPTTGAPTLFVHYLQAGNLTGALSSAALAVGGLTLYKGVVPTGGVQSFVLSSVASGTGVYTGTFTPANQWAGYYFTVTGFANAANNGTFLCTANSTTTITLVNASSVSQSAVATCTAVPLYGASVTVAGFANSGNNGTFSCVGSSPAGLLLSNSGGVAETHAATFSIPNLNTPSNFVTTLSPSAFNVTGFVGYDINISNGDSISVVVAVASLAANTNNVAGMLWVNVIEF